MLSLDFSLAETIFRAEAARAESNPGPPAWQEKIENLSQLCVQGKATTHIAFLGTILLARSVNNRADVKWIKPTHSQGAPNAFSARTLSEKVLVPLAAELGVHIGTTGPQPLNNQPYFRMSYLGDDTPMSQGARPAFEYMRSLLKDVEAMPDEMSAREALRAYISVRKQHVPFYAPADRVGALSGQELTSAILRLIAADSEGGKRAQAVVAGLLDVAVGADRVVTDRINSPSRRYPGDVCVLEAPRTTKILKAFEVKDKPVTSTDVQIFGRKCLEFDVREAAYVMVAGQQNSLDQEALLTWAAVLHLGLTLFPTWPPIVAQCLFWGPLPSPDGAVEAVGSIRQRLIGIEASPASVETWDELVADCRRGTPASPKKRPVAYR